MKLLDKIFCKELERQLALHFRGTALNGFTQIAVGEACSDCRLAIAGGEIIANPQGYVYKLAFRKIIDETRRLGKLQSIYFMSLGVAR